MIYQGSRYETAKIVAIPDSEGAYHATVYPQPSSPTFNYVTHQVRFGDRLDVLAAVAFGDAELWWKIALVNPEILYPDDLQVGSLIRIPTTAVS